MKRFFIMAVAALMCATATMAQTTKEELKALNKERKIAQKYTEKQLGDKALKMAKKEAKRFAKEGWKAEAGALPLEKQYEENYIKMYAMDGKFPRYILGTGTATAASHGVARKQAMARARVEIANQLSQEIAALTEETTTNLEVNNLEAETVSKMVETSKLLTQQTLGKTVTVLEAFRTTDKGTEYKVIVSYESKAAIKSLLDSFKEDEADIKQKLEELLK